MITIGARLNQALIVNPDLKVAHQNIMNLHFLLSDSGVLRVKEDKPPPALVSVSESECTQWWPQGCLKELEQITQSLHLVELEE